MYHFQSSNDLLYTINIEIQTSYLIELTTQKRFWINQCVCTFGAILFAVECPEITMLGAGIAKIDYSNNRIVNSTAIHMCLENYTPNDDLVRTCEVVTNMTADWSMPEETCRRMLSSNSLLQVTSIMNE